MRVETFLFLGAAVAEEPLFGGLWFWMRWLCLGLMALLHGLIRIVGSPGLAIVLLAGCVRLIMLPFTLLAERWQRDVNAQESRLQPRLAAIKASFRGEEQTRRILAAHRELGIHPLYRFKSAFGFLIQIPVLLGAYYMLKEDPALAGARFLWISDLTQPDRLMSLPFQVPYFGGYLNLLPFLMTAVTVIASLRFDDGSLSPDLLRRQRRALYWMAAVFFVLFYRFPAGMVLFWTMNNVFYAVMSHLRKHRRGGPGDCAAIAP